MSVPRLHDGEIASDAALVHRLLAAQFPHWAELPVARVPSGGTDNAMYRLGADMSVRLPRIAWAVAAVEKEWRWLPRLAQHLPLPVPLPLARGVPGEGYPWSWSICRWLEGENPLPDRLPDPNRVATDLAQFLLALQRIDPAEGPPPGAHNFGRGMALAARDRITRKAIAQSEGLLDIAAATAAWEKDLRAAPPSAAPVWIHGDLNAGNLLLRGGRLGAVLDFEGLAVGDPAVDLILAWSLFSGEAREIFRRAMGVDDATWARGRGWALSVALMALPYYRTSNPPLAKYAARTIAAVLAEHGLG
ncbi:MAG: aminoglycoside phosphotransferase family protein [Rhizomicrobium sp.]